MALLNMTGLQRKALRWNEETTPAGTLKFAQSSVSHFETNESTENLWKKDSCKCPVSHLAYKIRLIRVPKSIETSPMRYPSKDSSHGKCTHSVFPCLIKCKDVPTCRILFEKSLFDKYRFLQWGWFLGGSILDYNILYFFDVIVCTVNTKT